jgi:hypothetical protein
MLMVVLIMVALDSYQGRLARFTWIVWIRTIVAIVVAKVSEAEENTHKSVITLLASASHRITVYIRSHRYQRHSAS